MAADRLNSRHFGSEIAAYSEVPYVPINNSSRRVASVCTALSIVLASFALRSTPVPAAEGISAARMSSIVRAAMARNHLKAVIVQVRSNGRTVFNKAFGESMSGVPATPDMHFRNGALAFTYMATLLLEFVDQKKVTLQTKLAKYFPNLPNANQVTLKDLAQMTSGYADYVYEPEFQDGLLPRPISAVESRRAHPYRDVQADPVRTREK